MWKQPLKNTDLSKVCYFPSSSLYSYQGLVIMVTKFTLPFFPKAHLSLPGSLILSYSHSSSGALVYTYGNWPRQRVHLQLGTLKNKYHSYVLFIALWRHSKRRRRSWSDCV